MGANANKIIHIFLPFNFYYAALPSVPRYLTVAGMSFNVFHKRTLNLNMHVSISVVIHMCKWLTKKKREKATTTMTTTKKETEESGASCWWIMELKLLCLL